MAAHEPSACCLKNGYQYKSTPSAKMIALRRSTPNRNSFSLLPGRIEKLNALPTANRNDGNTRSANVNPNQGACTIHAGGSAPGPGVLTRIIKNTVRPRNTSNERKRSRTDVTVAPAV